MTQTAVHVIHDRRGISRQLLGDLQPMRDRFDHEVLGGEGQRAFRLRLRLRHFAGVVRPRILTQVVHRVARNADGRDYLAQSDRSEVALNDAGALQREHAIAIGADGVLQLVAGLVLRAGLERLVGFRLHKLIASRLHGLLTILAHGRHLLRDFGHGLFVLLGQSLHRVQCFLRRLALLGNLAFVLDDGGIQLGFQFRLDAGQAILDGLQNVLRHFHLP